MTGEEKDKGGRPPFKITQEIIEKVEGLAAQGLIDVEIASVIGCHISTLSLKKKQFSKFSEAIKRGKHKWTDEVTNALFEKAKTGDNTAMIFYLKCRAGWRETDDSRQQEDPKPLNITINTVDSSVRRD